MCAYWHCLASSYVDNLAVSLATRVPVIVADALVLVLTWMKTYQQVRDARRLNISLSVTTCLVRDGESVAAELKRKPSLLHI